MKKVNKALEAFLDDWERRTKTMPQAKLTKRSQLKKIIERRLRGESFTVMAKEMGLTSARPQQIFAAYKRFESRKMR